MWRVGALKFCPLSSGGGILCGKSPETCPPLFSVRTALPVWLTYCRLSQTGTAPSTKEGRWKELCRLVEGVDLNEDILAVPLGKLLNVSVPQFPGI